VCFALGVILGNGFRFRIAALVLFSSALLVASIGQSSARPAICGKLERQLASSGTAATGSASTKFSNAARAQTQQLQIARGQARSAGCGGSVLSAGGQNNAACGRITSTIRRMEANLAKLQSKANSSGGVRPNRGRILAALDANDCNGRAVEQVAVKRKLPSASKANEPGLLTILFGATTKQRKIERTYEVASVEAPSIKKKVKVINGSSSGANQPIGLYDAAGGTFRTLCVRTCDGYYFPVSFSTTSSRFPVDEKACAAMCPGAETKLYYHSVPDQEPEEMISLAKEPYAAMPTAFQYRRDGIGADKSCTCQAKAPVDEAALDANDSKPKKAKWVPLPSSKPSLLEDDETKLNRIGGLDNKAIFSLLEMKMASQTLASQQNVRVVGPVFLPSQSTATDLQAPDRSSVQ
jgi:Protein of unknown function (DUF2865)